MSSGLKKKRTSPINGGITDEDGFDINLGGLSNFHAQDFHCLTRSSVWNICKQT